MISGGPALPSFGPDIGGYNWTGLGLVFVTDWAEK